MIQESSPAELPCSSSFGADYTVAGWPPLNPLSAALLIQLHELTGNLLGGELAKHARPCASTQCSARAGRQASQLENCICQRLWIPGRHYVSGVANQIRAVTYISYDARNPARHRFSDRIWKA